MQQNTIMCIVFFHLFYRVDSVIYSVAVDLQKWKKIDIWQTNKVAGLILQTRRHLG